MFTEGFPQATTGDYKMSWMPITVLAYYRSRGGGHLQFLTIHGFKFRGFFSSQNYI